MKYSDLMSEDKLQEGVRARCKLMDLYIHHERDSQESMGPGFPDLEIWGLGGAIFRELKDWKGRLSFDQWAWLIRIWLAGGNVGVWRPKDLSSGRIDRELAAIRKPSCWCHASPTSPALHVPACGRTPEQAEEWLRREAGHDRPLPRRSKKTSAGTPASTSPARRTRSASSTPATNRRATSTSRRSTET